MSTKLKTPPRDPNLPENVEEILRVWRTLESVVMSMDEPTLWAVLAYECANKGRHLFIQRLFGRASTLRARRESAFYRLQAKDRGEA